MNRGRLPESGLRRAFRCGRAALTQGVALDALLLVGLLGAALFSPGGWTTAFTIAATTGVGKTLLAGVVAAARCWTSGRLAPRSDQD